MQKRAQTGAERCGGRQKRSCLSGSVKTQTGTLGMFGDYIKRSGTRTLGTYADCQRIFSQNVDRDSGDMQGLQRDYGCACYGVYKYYRTLLRNSRSPHIYPEVCATTPLLSQCPRDHYYFKIMFGALGVMDSPTKPLPHYPT